MRSHDDKGVNARRSSGVARQRSALWCFRVHQGVDALQVQGDDASRYHGRDDGTMELYFSSSSAAHHTLMWKLQAAPK